MREVRNQPSQYVNDDDVKGGFHVRCYPSTADQRLNRYASALRRRARLARLSSCPRRDGEVTRLPESATRCTQGETRHGKPPRRISTARLNIRGKRLGPGEILGSLGVVAIDGALLRGAPSDQQRLPLPSFTGRSFAFHRLARPASWRLRHASLCPDLFVTCPAEAWRLPSRLPER